VDAKHSAAIQERDLHLNLSDLAVKGEPFRAIGLNQTGFTGETLVPIMLRE
jgi:hypothetical protein